MSLRWTAYVAPNPTKAGSKTQNGCFTVKKCTSLEESDWKSATKFLCVHTISDKVVRHSLTYLSCNNGSWERPLLCENLAKTDHPFQMLIDEITWAKVQDNILGFQFYRGGGLNFPFSYWFLHGPYNSAAIRRPCSDFTDMLRRL